MNPLLGMIAGGNGVMKQAILAMMSGQSAEDFMANLSKTDSRFQGVDMGNLQKSAQQLCHQKGVDEQSMIQQVTQQVRDLM